MFKCVRAVYMTKEDGELGKMRLTFKCIGTERLRQFQLEEIATFTTVFGLTVKEDEKYVKEPLDPKLFEWDTKVIRIV